MSYRPTTKADDAYTVKHWTRQGVFRVTPCNFPMSEIWLDDRFLGTCTHWLAGEEINSGRFDAEVGFEIKSLGVPDSLSDWNNARIDPKIFKGM